MNLFIRWAPGAASGAAAVRAALLALSSDLPTVEPQPVSDFLLLSLLPQRVAGTLGGGLGFAGLLLAALGVYGLVAMSTQQRRREIGIRMAIGASRANVLTLVFRDTLWLAAWGVAVGLVIALGAGQLIESLLIGVSPFDPISFAVGAIVVMITAGLATVGPARRAAGAEPMVALARD
jgi:ABC-type antimicrobial peptide transport system permease subunit